MHIKYSLARTHTHTQTYGRVNINVCTYVRDTTDSNVYHSRGRVRGCDFRARRDNEVRQPRCRLFFRVTNTDRPRHRRLLKFSSCSWVGHTVPNQWSDRMCKQNALYRNVLWARVRARETKRTTAAKSNIECSTHFVQNSHTYWQKSRYANVVWSMTCRPAPASRFLCVRHRSACRRNDMHNKPQVKHIHSANDNDKHYQRYSSAAHWLQVQVMMATHRHSLYQWPKSNKKYTQSAHILCALVSATGVGRAAKTDRAQCTPACTMIEHKRVTVYYMRCAVRSRTHIPSEYSEEKSRYNAAEKKTHCLNTVLCASTTPNIP